MMLAELDIDLLQAEMACWGPDDDESDDDTAEVDINDPRRLVGVNDAVRCQCPPLEPYPPAGWMSLERWETLDHLAGFPGVEVKDTEVWIPDEIGFEASLQVGFECDKFRTAFTQGEWYLFDTRHN